MHSWGVHFAFLEGEICILGVHLHFGGYTLHSWYTVHFGGWLIHFGGIPCILYIYSAFLEGALSLLGVHFVFWGFTYHFG